MVLKSDYSVVARRCQRTAVSVRKEKIRATCQIWKHLKDLDLKMKARAKMGEPD